MISSLLSKTPGLKQLIKYVYIHIIAIVYYKCYRIRLLSNELKGVGSVNLNCSETFFGYYDKSPENEDKCIIVHETELSTRQVPDPAIPLKIVLINAKTQECRTIGNSFSYTWQQGARTQWLNKDLVIYNDFREGRYVAVVWSMDQTREVRQFDFPVQDAFGTEYYLSINYRRIMNLRPDYGYRNLPLLSDEEIRDLQNDGIRKVNYHSGKCVLVHKLQEIIDCNYKPIFDKCLHKVNHVMINKTGTGFIFIHRYYQNKRRYDRLMYSDFKSLKVLVDDGMVSHCCWINDDMVLGYWQVKDKDGYYICDVPTGRITECPGMNGLGVGDGHPSCYKDWIVFDSYPDKSRMQKLFLYNMSSAKVIPLLEVYQSPRFMNQTRCDLHPRFSPDGKLVFFDTVYSGKRQLCYVDVSSVLN